MAVSFDLLIGILMMAIGLIFFFQSPVADHAIFTAMRLRPLRLILSLQKLIRKISRHRKNSKFISKLAVFERKTCKIAIDQMDRSILWVLQKAGRFSNSELSDQVGLSASA